MSAPSPIIRRPHGSRRLRRLVAAALALALSLGLLAAPTSGDEIEDLRSEAQRVADRIEELRHESEVLTERYLDARLERERLDEEIAGAAERAEASGAELDDLADQVRQVAVDGYVADGTTASASVLGVSDPTALTVAQGYVDAVGLDADDLLDAYRGQERRAGRDADDLARLRAEALEAEEQADADRQATEDMIAELEELEASIDDDLRALVEEEQRRREEEQLAAARAAAEDAERRQEAPAAADEPAAEEPAAPTTTEAPAPTQGRAPDPTPAPAPPTPPPSSASGAEAAIAAARSVLGVPYRWAGASPSGGFDCSGLTMWAWGHGGRSLPHSSRAQYAMARKIPVSQLQPGDLVFYNSPISHVGLYIGGGQMIHAPRTGKTVEIQSIYYWSALVGGGRI